MNAASGYDSIYDSIGVDYDLTRRADPYLATRMAHLLQLRNRGQYLDLACGTGNYTVSLAARGGEWTGMDLAPTMIERAREKSDRIRWEWGRAEDIQVADGTYDGVLCSLALHHFSDLDLAFREVRRVLRKGRFVMFTSSPEQMRGYWLNAYFPDAMARSIAQMPTIEAVTAACLRAGFLGIKCEPYVVQPDLQDGFLFHGKHHPRRYLSERSRAGISMFRVLADGDEVRTGCARLADDLRTGRFADVLTDYEHELGDYMFVSVVT
jgi:ubiquinone/menaquinone biosynthesis C-methylase UbiE